MRKSNLDFSRINAEKIFNNRFFILLTVLSLLVFLILARLYYLQVINFKYFDTLSETNRIKYVQSSPRRGIIFDRNNVVLADNSSLYAAQINIKESTDIQKIIEDIDKEISLSKIEIENFYEKKNKYAHLNNIIIKNNLTDEEIAKILSIRHKHDGLDVTASLLRRYPYKEITSHVVGSVGHIDKRDLLNLDKKKYINTQYIGKTGIEKFYEDILYGVPGYRHVEINAKGRELRDIEKKSALPGEDIYLTIDINLQQYMYSLLSGYTGSSIAMNPKNGEIVGIISSPAIDPNIKLWKYEVDQDEINKLDSPYFNRTVNGLYPPGSTIKPIVALSGLYHKVINSLDEYYAGPFFQLPNRSRKFRDWKLDGHGMVDVKKAIIQSSDVYFYMVANKLGIDKLSSFYRYFSFGSLTGIDFPNESQGILPSAEWKSKNIGNKWTDGDTLITGIGQGYFLTTPLQLVYAACIIANKGIISIPKLNINSKPKKNDEILKIENFLKNNISSEDWNLINDAMFKVVNQKNGTAYWSTNSKKNNIAGKTGTVQVYQISQNDDRKDDKEIPDHLKDHSLYIGYAPSDKPEIVVATVIENIGSGSKYAAPISNKIINYYLDNIRNNFE